MAYEQGDFNISTNVTLRKKGTWDARQYVVNYSDLLEFVEADQLPNGFIVTVKGDDDLNKRGIWMLLNEDDLSNPLSWYLLTQNIPNNQVLQIGSYSYDSLTYVATLGATLDWVFIEEGVTFTVGTETVNLTAPDATFPRADIIVWDSVNGYQVVEGTPAEDYTIPNTPVGTILVQTIIRLVDGSTEPIEPPDLSGYVTREELNLETLQKVATRGNTFLDPFRNPGMGSFGIQIGKSTTLGNSIFLGWNPNDNGYGLISLFGNGRPLVLQRRNDGNPIMPVMIGYNEGGITPDGTSMLMVRGDVNITGSYKINGSPLTSSFEGLTGDPYDNTALAAALDAKQDTLNETNFGEFMDTGLATKLTPMSGDFLLGRDSLTNEAVEIPFSTVQPALGYTAANDANVVKLTGNQSIAGVKTFTNSVYLNDRLILSSTLPATPSGSFTLLARDNATGFINGENPANFASSSSVVTLTGNQSIAGIKTFTNDVDVNGDLFVEDVKFNTATLETPEVGKLTWNDADGTLDLGLKGGNVVLQIGQEQLVRVVNKTGTNLTEAGYQAVRVDGAQGQRLKVALALADNDANSAETIGLVTENILNNEEGFITTVGLVRNINTTGSLQGETWADGDMLYLSGTVAGRITKVKPVAPTHTIVIGYVVHAHATQGSIYVKVDNGYELDELHNVKITTVANNEGLFYDSAQGLWVNKTVNSALGYTPENVANKSSDLTSPDNTKYPTTLAVSTALAAKQNTLTNPITGTGTTNFLPKFSGTNTISNSQIFDNGTNVGIATAAPDASTRLDVNGATRTTRLGAGILPNTAAHTTIAANTASVGQVLFTPSATDYTGTVSGMLWNNASEWKFYDSVVGSVNRFMKLNGNSALANSNSLNVVTSTGTGGNLGTLKAEQAFGRYPTAVSYTVLLTDVGMGWVIAVTDTSAARTITLPLANTVSAGWQITVKDESGLAGVNNITISRAGSDTIDGATSAIINSNYGSRTLYSNGVDKWFII